MLEQEGHEEHGHAYVNAHVQGQEQVERQGQGQPGRLCNVAALKQQEQERHEHAYVNALAHVQKQGQSQKQWQGQGQPEMIPKMSQQEQGGEQK